MRHHVTVLRSLYELHILVWMASYFLVERTKGPAWDHSRGLREQLDWNVHAAFMDELAADGFIVLGGPAGNGDKMSFVFLVAADGEAEVRARLARDPWPDDRLRISDIRPWTILLGSVQ